MEDDEQSPTLSSPSSSQTAAAHLRGVLKSHGIALVRGVPTDSAETEALGRKVGGRVMSTIFGEAVWVVSTEMIDPDSEFRDVVYAAGGLQLHTDQSYMSEPPKLQVTNKKSDLRLGDVEHAHCHQVLRV